MIWGIVWITISKREFIYIFQSLINLLAQRTQELEISQALLKSNCVLVSILQNPLEIYYQYTYKKSLVHFPITKAIFLLLLFDFFFFFTNYKLIFFFRPLK